MEIWKSEKKNKKKKKNYCKKKQLSKNPLHLSLPGFSQKNSPKPIILLLKISKSFFDPDGFRTHQAGAAVEHDGDSGVEAIAVRPRAAQQRELCALRHVAGIHRSEPGGEIPERRAKAPLGGVAHLEKERVVIGYEIIRESQGVQTMQTGASEESQPEGS